MNSLRLTTVTTFDRLTFVTHTDPDQARRGRLLNILLLGTGVAGVVGIVAIIIFGLTQGGFSSDSIALIISGAFLIMLVSGLYFVNRRVSPRLAGIVFLVGLLGILAISDEPQQLVGGRTTLAFALPIIMSSVLVSPGTSFIVAGLVSTILFGISVYYAPAETLSATTVLGFLLVALVGWLASRNLEQALSDLRTINRELDKRVADRTRELSQALSREQAEAGKNEAILQSIADGVIVFDESNRAVTANPAISELLDQSLSRIIGRDLRQLMGTTVAAAQQETATTLFRNQASRPAPINIDWGPKTVSVSIAPLQATSGELAGSVAVFRDVTREAELNRMKSAFVSMVSHELRTPLNAIQGYAEILQQNVYGLLNDKQSGVVERIMTNINRLLAIVGDLLDQAHMEAGTLAIQYAPFSPAELVEGLYSVVSGMAQSKGLQLSTTIEPNLPATLTGDPHRLNQVLINLVTNAIKYTEAGSVTVRLYRPDANQWAIEVADTGRGISASAQSYIFEPFRQVDSSIGRKHSGVGLGLSIVKRLVSLMHGEIKVASEVGRGSMFTVILPMNPARAVQPQIRINY